VTVTSSNGWTIWDFIALTVPLEKDVKAFRLAFGKDKKLNKTVKRQIQTFLQAPLDDNFFALWNAVDFLLHSLINRLTHASDTERRECPRLQIERVDCPSANAWDQIKARLEQTAKKAEKYNSGRQEREIQQRKWREKYWVGP